MPRAIQSRYPTLVRPTITVDISKGGTASENALDAVHALGGISTNDINKPFGPVSLGTDGLIPVALFNDADLNNVSITGPSSLQVDKIGVYTITNYNAFITYAITAAVGTVDVVEDVIYYTAPATPQAGGFTINNRKINVQVTANAILTPVVMTPVEGDISQSSSPTFTASASSVLGSHVLENLTAYDGVAGDQFGASISLTGDGTLLAVGAPGKNTNGIIDAGQVYFYQKSGDTWTYLSALSPSDGAQGDLFGSGVALSYDGTLLAVGAPGRAINGASGAGQVYLYQRSGFNWNLLGTLHASDYVSNAGYGSALAFSTVSNKLIVGSPNKGTTTYSATGQAYIYMAVGGNWVEEATITAVGKVGYEHFGSAVGLNSDGTHAVIGERNRTASGYTGLGQVTVYNMTNQVWGIDATITPPELAGGLQFGASVYLAPSGTDLMIGASGRSEDGVLTAGKIYLYKKTTGWNLVDEYLSETPEHVDQFGSGIAFSTLLAVTAISAAARDDLKGAVYLTGLPIHLSSDWELATNPAFVSPVRSTLMDASSLTSWSVIGLTPNTDYYLRCRYNIQKYGYSAWSTTRHFKTHA